MVRCRFCNSLILFGGKPDGSETYCSEECVSGARLLSQSKNLLREDIESAVERVHSGRCPLCRDDGPVDVHTSYRIWSAVILTNWGKRRQVCCRPCGIKAKVEDFVFCLFLGWWGIPFGLVGTPVQLMRNLIGIFRSPDGKTPSATLREFVAINLAAENERQLKEGSDSSSETAEAPENPAKDTNRLHRPSDTAPIG